MNWSGNTSKPTRLAEWRSPTKQISTPRSVHLCANYKTTPRKSVPSTKSHLSNTPHESEPTYGLINIDEIQRAPDLLLAIKKTVDEDYRPGRFVFTGSANVLTLPRIADSLAGRMETIQMLPLARAEVEGRRPTFLDHLFEGKLRSQRDAILGDELVQLVLVGGFPEAISRDS